MDREPRKLKPLTAEELALLDEGWEEVGRSVAASIVEGGKNLKWAWDLLRPLGLYKHWMLNHWIQRYENENPSTTKKANKRKRKTKDASVFTKREQISQALRMLGDGVDPLEYFKQINEEKPNG